MEPSTKPGTPLLYVSDLCKAYQGRPILQNISFGLAAGERLAITGPSGSGKTTLLNCIGGVDRPDRGSILFRGVAMESLSVDALAEIRRKQVGTVFQFFHLLPTLTAAENVEIPLQLNGIPESERILRVRELLARVEVAHRANAFPGELSGGEMQRVAIARALAHKPALLIADEPTGNLDTRNGRVVLKLLREMSDETGATLVLVTHSAEAAQICHRNIHLIDGKIATEKF